MLIKTNNIIFFCLVLFSSFSSFAINKEDTPLSIQFYPAFLAEITHDQVLPIGSEDNSAVAMTLKQSGFSPEIFEELNGISPYTDEALGIVNALTRDLNTEVSSGYLQYLSEERKISLASYDDLAVKINDGNSMIDSRAHLIYIYMKLRENLMDRDLVAQYNQYLLDLPLIFKYVSTDLSYQLLLTLSRSQLLILENANLCSINAEWQSLMENPAIYFYDGTTGAELTLINLYFGIVYQRCNSGRATDLSGIFEEIKSVMSRGIPYDNSGIEDLKDKDLSWLSFFKRNLSKAKFGKADLRGTSFARSDLRGADLKHTKNSNLAIYEGAFYNKKTRLPFSHEMAKQKGMHFLELDSGHSGSSSLGDFKDDLFKIALLFFIYGH
jgi:hypothetical protein